MFYCGSLVLSCTLVSIPAYQAFHVSHTRTRALHPPNVIYRQALHPAFPRLEPLFVEVSEDRSSQTRVRSMASFLATKMLEQVLMEASKDDGTSKLTEEDAMSLLNTLQTMSETKTAQGNLSSTWQAADDAVEENFLAEDEKVNNKVTTADKETRFPSDEISPVEESGTITPVESKDTKSQGLNAEEEEQPAVLKRQVEGQRTTASPTPVAPSPPKQTVDPAAKSKQEQFQRSLLAARLQNSARPRIQPIAVTEAPSVTPSGLPSDDGAAAITSVLPRFPDIVSKEFGKALEVTTSGVPALRESSVPPRSNDSDFSAGIQAVSNEAPETGIEPLTDALAPNIEAAINPEDSTTALVDEMPQSAASSLPEDATVMAPTSLASCTEKTADPHGTTTTKAFLDDMSRSGVASPQNDEKAVDNDGGKYHVKMELKTAETNGPEENVASTVGDDDAAIVTSTDTAQTEDDVYEASSLSADLRDSVLEPIKSFWNQPRGEPMFPSVASSQEGIIAPLPSMDQAIREARQQPKSPEEEAQLAAKYAQIEDLGDRAYAILKNLGMI